MTKRSRYLLLGCCIAAFLIVAPLIILYVRGIAFNFQTGKFVATGILSVRSQPSDAQVYLDGKLARSGAGDLHFVSVGQHQLTLKRPGYSDWSKRLTVQSGQVTWANPAFGSVYLLFSQPTAAVMATSVADFIYQNGKTFFLSGQYFYAGAFVPNQQFSLPMPADRIIQTDPAGRNFILAGSSGSGTVLLNTNGTTTDLSRLFAAPASYQFDDNGQLYALAGDTLYSVNIGPDNKATTTPLFNEVKAFTAQGGLLYFISRQALKPGELDVSQFPFTQSQALLQNLPPFRQAQLFVTSQKQIFLLADGRLYLANSAMQQLADNVAADSFDRSSSVLAILHAGELDYFDPLAGSLDFVTRSSQALENFGINTTIDYAIFQTDNQVEALELDTRDRQNQYALYASRDIKKIALDASGKNLMVLDGATLKNLTIR